MVTLSSPYVDCRIANLERLFPAHLLLWEEHQAGIFDFETYA